jgi:hypothetical protein
LKARKIEKAELDPQAGSGGTQHSECSVDQ